MFAGETHKREKLKNNFELKRGSVDIIYEDDWINKLNNFPNFN